MATVALHFTARKYHATPWGRHVNEGEVEWPPSPWRVLRALLGVGFTKRGWREPPEDAVDLVRSLAGVSPSFRLPPGVVSHTRHYMPILKGRSAGTTKVLDAFIRLRDDDPLLIHYPVDLAHRGRALLADLVAGLGYLGRAESWVEAQLVPDAEPGPQWSRPRPSAAEPPATGRVDTVVLLGPVAEPDYARWRQEVVNAALEGIRGQKGRPATKGELGRIEAEHPPDLMACLLAETADLQKQGWSAPPGSVRLLYDRPAGILEARPPRPPVRRPRTPIPTVAVLALAADRPTETVLPLMQRALPQMELIHRCLLSKLGEDAPDCPVLTGRDPGTGQPLTGAHGHAHLLPLDLDEDGRLDHVVVYAPDGLDARARSAIRRLRRTWTRGNDGEIHITLAGLTDVSGLSASLRRRSGSTIAEFATSSSWLSVTPFVPPRFIKKRRHTLRDQVQAELRSRRLPEAKSIEIMDRSELVARGLLRFERERRGGSRPGGPRPLFGLRLHFDKPTSGPISLGYASHFGLGLFAAEDGLD